MATAKAKPTVKARGKTEAVATPRAKVALVTKASPPKPVAKVPPKVEIKVAAAKAVVKVPEKIVAEKATVKAAPKPTLVPRKAEAREPGLLTEAEMLRQPKSEYMSVAQRHFFRQRLLKLQQQMRENADATTVHLRELSVAPDPADRATQEEEHALELRTRDRERKLLKKIESALLHLEDGSYGYCEETGDAIGVPRLLARPTATLTIEAQERRELKQKMYGE